MVDTQRISATSLLAMHVAEVTSRLAREREERYVHAFEVTTHFPLDVETIARTLDVLTEEYPLRRICLDEIVYYRLDDPEAFEEDEDAGARLAADGPLMRELAELLESEEQEMRAVLDQHELLAVVSELRASSVELSSLTCRTTLSNAKIKSFLNDWTAEEYVAFEVVDDEAHYTFPELDYPEERRRRVREALDEIREHGRRGRHAALWLLAAAAILLLVLLLVVGRP
jgi:hypothetical protein